MNLHIGICDDEQIEIDYLKTVVRNWADKGSFALQIKSFYSAENFLFEYSQDKKYDILLLDIQMDKLDGVSLAKQIRTQDNDVQIIFITGYPDFIFEGYEVSALHYLMKPVKEEKLYQVLDKALKNISRQSRSIYLPNGNENIRILVDTIEYIEVFDHQLIINTKEKTYSVKMPLYKIEDNLTDTFVRCHRCYIANLCHISKITKTEITLDSGKTISLSRRLYQTVNCAMIKYLKGE